MRRIMQRSGAEIIHLGHNRSVQEIVQTAIQEDVQGIAITSYQGGHNEYFKYMHDLLAEQGGGHIKLFGGGGGTILPSEIKDLHDYGISRIYSPDDGRAMGLQGMINDLLEQCDYPLGQSINGELKALNKDNPTSIARLISAIENYPDESSSIVTGIQDKIKATPVLGITGTGGAGKSSLVDELIRRFTLDFTDKSVAVISVDPSKRKTGGALLGDRIRMNSLGNNSRIYMRSLATRQSNLALSKHVQGAVDILKAADFDLIILETSGIGQSDTEIVDHSDASLYVMTPEYGAATQLEKIDMLDFADIIAINKFDKRGALDALRDVKKQYQRNHGLWDQDPNDMPVFGTIASQFNDPGMNALYTSIISVLNKKTNSNLLSQITWDSGVSEKIYIIPPNRTRYLSEISEQIHAYDKRGEDQAKLATQLYSLKNSIDYLSDKSELKDQLQEEYDELLKDLDGPNLRTLESWQEKKESYKSDEFVYTVRNREIKVPTYSKTLAQTKIPRVSLPRYNDWGDIIRWVNQENVPGEYPYTAGVFPFKRKNEDPTRMFAGEGGPERTNTRFHYLSKDMPAARLSTAFDSVTLYGEDPDHRPDIYGKVGNSGVSICSLDDAKRLYSGFDLCDPTTSVSMTINGPAATICAFFMNAAIDQQCELYGLTGDEILDADVYQSIKARALNAVRGTVQADILKEDQAQNTCIFSTEFSLKLMGDVQQYFIDHKVRNFYSVSISGYHIAEAGANPISQLAFTLANGFTFVEYYISRGMDINAFAPNLSFFFSNGVDAEYAVIGRVARRIWAKAMREKYGADDRSQKLKYHIQTSGRSLHAQEISFNDIRTTLQALYAIYDNCNSLHTNAYDEAITTPTEESVRRAMAIQLIINHEFGLAKNENPNHSFIIEELKPHLVAASCSCGI
ncbi:UNVERIFIED_CONTAM: hypothetical protein GTU68_029541 [Idotea baltica]|nr:hypothetical protein [Idotea baltica]